MTLVHTLEEINRLFLFCWLMMMQEERWQPPASMASCSGKLVGNATQMRHVDGPSLTLFVLTSIWAWIISNDMNICYFETQMQQVNVPSGTLTLSVLTSIWIWIIENNMNICFFQQWINDSWWNNISCVNVHQFSMLACQMDGNHLLFSDIYFLKKLSNDIFIICFC